MMAHEELTQSSPHAEVTEQDLVQRVQAGDTTAFDALYLRTYRATIRALGTGRYEDMPAALQDRLLSFLQTRLTRVPQACQGGRDQG
jgi:hypothetical protein